MLSLHCTLYRPIFTMMPNSFAFTKLPSSGILAWVTELVAPVGPDVYGRRLDDGFRNQGEADELASRPRGPAEQRRSGFLGRLRSRRLRLRRPGRPLRHAVRPTMRTITVQEWVPEKYETCRTVYKEECTQEKYTAYRTECCAEQRTHQVTVYKSVCETHNETRCITKCIPVCEQRTRQQAGRDLLPGDDLHPPLRG